MDADRFDAWTRRRFGLAVGSSATLLLVPATIDDAAAGRKRRRKRCRKLGRRCNPGGRRKCCGKLACGDVAELTGKHCCKRRFASCAEDSDCCGDLGCVGGKVRVAGPAPPPGEQFCDILT